MTRRTAIQNMILASAGITLLPACQFESGPVYANVPLEKGQRTFIDLLTKAILPTEETAITTPESTTDFILTMLNDCTSPEDIQKYLIGIKEFQQGIQAVYGTTMKEMATDKQLELFMTLGKSEKMTPAAKYFFNITNGLTRRHFTGSEHFMKTVQEFEFLPARYIGCRLV